MEAVRDLLKYYEEYGVLICVRCQFAVQPSALTRHLLKHQIYRGERRKLLSSLYQLRLEQPGNVQSPPVGSPAFLELPVYRGYRCQAHECQHVCASQKRMSQHWSEAHGERESRNVRAREAWLQTFFRGNKVRYFEVAPPPAIPSHELPGESSAETSTTPTPSGTDVKESHSPPSGQRRGSDGSSSDNCPPLDLKALRYYHRYLTSDNITPSFAPSEGNVVHWSSWHIAIAHEAHRHQFLMYGILGLAALELSYTTADAREARGHREASFIYQNKGLGEFLSISRQPQRDNAVAIVAYATLTNFQRICSIPDHEDGYAPFSQAVEIIHLFRGQFEAHLSAQPLLPPDSCFILSPDDVRFLTDRDDVLGWSSPSIPPKIRGWLQNLEAELSHALAGPSGAPSADDWNAQVYAHAIALLYPSYEHCYSMAPFLAAAGGWNTDHDVPPPSPLGFAFWVRFVPESFIGLLRHGKPAALVIFAHWWWLTKGVEFGSWFAKDHNSSILDWIAGGLSGHLRELVTRLIREGR